MAFGWAGAGAEAADELQALLVRAFEEKQKQEAAARAEAQLDLQRQAETRMGAQQQSMETDRRQQQANLETERGFRRAGTIAGAALPDDPVDATTAALLREHGFGGQVRETPKQGAHLGVDESAVDQHEVVPELRMRGGSQYLNAQAQREAAAANAAANRSSVEERAAADRQLREDIARMQAGGQAETRDLSNRLKELQVQAAEEKLAATKKEREKTESDARATTQNAYDLATRLETHPGLGASTGAYELRTGITQESRDFLAMRDQLVAALTQPNLGALKGPMSDKDVVFVKEMATRLQKPRISDTEFLRAVTEAKAFLERKGATAAPSAAADGGKRTYYDADGNPVRR